MVVVCILCCVYLGASLREFVCVHDSRVCVHT